MGEEETYVVNDTMRGIRKVVDSLKKVDGSSMDGRIKAMILTKLEEAELLLTALN